MLILEILELNEFCERITEHTIIRAHATYKVGTLMYSLGASLGAGIRSASECTLYAYIRYQLTWARGDSDGEVHEDTLRGLACTRVHPEVASAPRRILNTL